MNIAIIGGGASGYFAALAIAERLPEAKVQIFEKTGKTLAKVKVSGGGRCNVTNHCFEPRPLSKNYPRGEKKLVQVFGEFGPKEVVDWFEQRGVDLKVEPDGRMFPESNSSQTIIDCFRREADKLGVELKTHMGMSSLEKNEDLWRVRFDDDQSLDFDKVVIATGSSKKIWSSLEGLGLKVSPPVPSLFTFNIDDPRLDGLPGLVFENAEVKVAKSKLLASGPLLVTHWGLSGPAILRLSAWGAKDLADRNYEFTILVKLLGDKSYDEIRELLIAWRDVNSKKKVVSNGPAEVPKRYWERLVTLQNLNPDLRWHDVGKKLINKWSDEVGQAMFSVKGKSTFKDEFVTCGGVELGEVDTSRFESRDHEGLFFTGEVLNIDAITGGFNFQACWSTAWTVAQAIGRGHS